MRKADSLAHFAVAKEKLSLSNIQLSRKLHMSDTWINSCETSGFAPAWSVLAVRGLLAEQEGYVHPEKGQTVVVLCRVPTEDLTVVRKVLGGLGINLTTI